MSEQAGGTTVPEQGGEGGAQAPDFSQFAQTFDTFTGDFNGWRETLEERLDGIEAGLAPEETEEPAEEAWQPGPEDYQADGQSLTPEAAQRYLETLIDQRVETRVEARLSDAEQQRQEREAATHNEQYADSLEERIPELADLETAKKYVDLATDWAVGMGRPDLVGDARVLEQVYMASKFRELAEQGALPAGAEQEVHLEHGAGAVPQPGQEPDLGAAIVTAAQRRKF